MRIQQDKEIIKKFLSWCISQDFNQTQVGEAVGRSQSWASQLYQGKINRLSFRTRNRILRILGGKP